MDAGRVSEGRDPGSLEGGRSHGRAAGSSVDEMGLGLLTVACGVLDEVPRTRSSRVEGCGCHRHDGPAVRFSRWNIKGKCEEW
jgi:hypothetical protein